MDELKKGDFIFIKETLSDTAERRCWYGGKEGKTVKYLINKIGRIDTNATLYDGKQIFHTTLHPRYTFLETDILHLEATKFIINSGPEKGKIFYLLNILDTQGRLVRYEPELEQPVKYSKKHLRAFKKNITVVSMSCKKECWKIIGGITYKHSEYKKLED